MNKTEYYIDDERFCNPEGKVFAGLDDWDKLVDELNKLNKENKVKDIEIASLKLAWLTAKRDLEEISEDFRSHLDALRDWLKKDKIPERLLQSHLPLSKEQQAILQDMWDRAMDYP